METEEITFPIPITDYVVTVKIPVDISCADAKNVCDVIMALSEKPLHDGRGPG